MIKTPHYATKYLGIYKKNMFNIKNKYEIYQNMFKI